MTINKGDLSKKEDEMSTPFSNREMLRLYMDLQLAVALSSPEHLDSLRAEEGRKDFTVNEILEHFAGLNGAQETFASRYRALLVDNWAKIDSQDNQWYAGELYQHHPSALEAALYFFAATGLFRLKKEMIPEIISAMEKAKQEVLIN